MQATGQLIDCGVTALYYWKTRRPRGAETVYHHQKQACTLTQPLLCCDFVCVCVCSRMSVYSYQDQFLFYTIILRTFLTVVTNSRLGFKFRVRIRFSNLIVMLRVRVRS